MAVKIRLTRIGAKKAPIYRIVVMNSSQPRNGRVIEMLGRYNPRTNPVSLELNKARAEYWLSKGAIPTDVMMRLLSYAGLVEKPAPPKKKVVEELKEVAKPESKPAPEKPLEEDAVNAEPVETEVAAAEPVAEEPSVEVAEQSAEATDDSEPAA